MFRTIVSLATVLLLTSQVSAVELRGEEAIVVESAEEKIPNKLGSATNPQIERVIDMVDINGDKKVGKRELMTTLEAIAKLFDYKITQTDRGQLEFLWGTMDVNGDNSLSIGETRKVLEKAPIMSHLNKWSEDKMIAIVEKKEAGKK